MIPAAPKGRKKQPTNRNCFCLFYNNFHYNSSKYLLNGYDLIPKDYLLSMKSTLFTDRNITTFSDRKLQIEMPQQSLN